MNKVAVWGAGALAFPSAVMSATLLSAPVAVSDPSSGDAGPTYGEVVPILESQGIKVVKTNRSGNDLPLSQCIVDRRQQNLDEIVLWVDCDAS